jgi:iron complex outermembrane receptor protein
MKCRVPSSGRTILAVSVHLALLSFCGAAQAAEDSTLPAIDVRAAAVGEVANGPVQGYLATRSATATKTDTAIADTAQSISVVTQDEIKAHGAQTIQGALLYTPGVIETNDDSRYDLITIRGMDTVKYRDGLRMVKTGNFADSNFDVQGLERVEVLKGPASVLYGQSSPGGIINQVSKRPSLDALNEIALTAGSFDRFQGAIDVGGALSSDKTVLFRLNAMVRDSNTQVDHGKDDRQFIAPSLSFQLSPDSKLTLLADRVQVRGTPANYALEKFLTLPLAKGKVSRSWFLGEPDFDKYDRDDTSVAALFEHNFGGWKLNANVRKNQAEVDYRHLYADDMPADGRTMPRGALSFASKTDSLVMDTNLQGKVQTGAVAHTLLFGVDYQNTDYRHDYAGGRVGPIDLYEPVYGAAVEMGPANRQTQKLRQLGFYAQDQARFGSWVANLGLRHDKSHGDTLEDGKVQSANDSKVSYNAGLLYKLANGVSPYVSYATSFNPVTNVGFDGGAFKPETAQQAEVGVKYQPAGYNALLTMSLFQLRNQNVSTLDVLHPGHSVQTGEVRTRGLELEAKASLNRQLDVTAAYSLYDTKTTKSNDETELNTSPVATARHTASVWGDYRFVANELKGWGAGFGVRALGKTAGGYTGLSSPGYAVLDAALHYQKGPVAVRFIVSNLTDRETRYWGQKFYGPSRKASATVSYLW